MKWTERRKRFRDILFGNKCLHPASVFDPMSARIAEDLGFETGVLAGSVSSMAVLGAPDFVTLTLSELAEQAYRVCRAGNLPLLIDADNGYGNALNVMRTVEELERAGVSALTIEDTDLPMPFAQTGKSRLVSLEEGIGKMRAALEARQDQNLVIVARTGAMGITDQEDALRRIKAYEKSGVDAIFLVGVRHKDQLEAVHAAVSTPILLAHPGEELDVDYMQSHGVRICLQQHIPFMAAVEAVYRTMKALREGQTQDQVAREYTSPELMKKVRRDDEYQRWTKEYLTPFK